jgi:putative spermidine/putrescine transport system permease protein
MNLRRQIQPWIWLAPAGALLIPFFLIPLLLTLRNSVYIDDPFGALVPGFTGANYLKVLSDPYYLHVFGNTLVAALAIVILCLVTAYPFAWLLARSSGARRTLLTWIIYLPIYVSVILRVFGWMVVLGDSGIVNQALLSSHLADQPVRIMSELSGMIVGMVHRYLPLMVLPLVTAFRRVDEAILKASANLGGTTWFTWRRILLPVSLPGAVAGAQLVFAGALSDYVIPSLMGTTRFQMLAPAIYYEATVNASWALSGAMATLVLAAVAAFIVVANLVLRRVAPWASF